MSERNYSSPLRSHQAKMTRTLIARAARERFLGHGWSGTTIRSVATAAGVSEATVYGVYGSKAGLATSLVDAADDAADTARAGAELRAAQGDPAAQVRALVGFDRRLFESAGDVLRIIVEARRQHDALDQAYRSGRERGETVRREVYDSWPANVWRPRMTVEHALDVAAVTCSIETFDILRAERGWSPDRIETWWAATLCEHFFGSSEVP